MPALMSSELYCVDDFLHDYPARRFLVQRHFPVPWLLHLASVLMICLLSSGCGSDNPVMEGDSEAIVALKNAGVAVSRVPTPGLPDMIGHSIDVKGVPLTSEIVGHLSKVGSAVELKLTSKDVTDDTLTAISS